MHLRGDHVDQSICWALFLRKDLKKRSVLQWRIAGSEKPVGLAQHNLISLLCNRVAVAGEKATKYSTYADDVVLSEGGFCQHFSRVERILAIALVDSL